MTDWDELNRKFSTGLSSIIRISPKSPQGAFSGDWAAVFSSNSASWQKLDRECAARKEHAGAFSTTREIWDRKWKYCVPSFLFLVLGKMQDRLQITRCVSCCEVSSIDNDVIDMHLIGDNTNRSSLSFVLISFSHFQRWSGCQQGAEAGTSWRVAGLHFKLF